LFWLCGWLGWFGGLWPYGFDTHVDEFLEVFVYAHDCGVLALLLHGVDDGVYDKCDRKYDRQASKQRKERHEWFEQAANRVCTAILCV